MKCRVFQFLRKEAHIGVVFLQQLSQGLQEGHQELSRLAEHPAWLSNKDAQENAANFKLAWSSSTRHCEVFGQLSTQSKNLLSH